jgi:phosphotransferase system enzyme I (PtsP)
MTVQDVSGWAGPRRLLRQLRDLMKGGGTAQERLDKVVALIARDMRAEVCSVYVLRPGEVLELFATEGLKPEAVHQTRLRVGEGLVGQIALNAQALRVADAQSHPHFAYRPETGEELFRSLMGVPVLRNGRMLGVLVVQSQASRQYSDEELEVLETVAMVLAELVAGGELVAASETRVLETRSLQPVRLRAIVLNAGLARGQTVLHQRGIVIRQTVAEHPEAEILALENAVGEMHESLDRLLRSAPMGARGGEHEEVLATYRMFAKDRGWLNRIREAVRTGLTAPAAVQKVQNDTRARMSHAKDPYLRERLSDLDDLTHRLLHHLLGAKGTPEAPDLPEDVILVARSLGPAELLDYDRDRLRAVVLEEGSPSSHVAIVARALDIPVLGRCRDVLKEANDGDPALVDGDTGQLLLRPGEGVSESFAESMVARRHTAQQTAAERDLPPVTRDGTRIGLMINAGLLVDLPQLNECGADGIGLYRTEVPFMVRRDFPDVATQTRLYGEVLSQSGGRPVTFRTLDIGGDKVLPYYFSDDDENPAMGWRGLRVGLDRPAILRQQLRALVRAAAGVDLRVMFPMVRSAAEAASARELLEMEMDRARREGYAPPRAVQVGVMLEVPALIWQLPALFRSIDFIAVGSNDLMQFLFASDRGNPRLSRRFDVLSPAVFKILRQITAAADEAGVAVSVCGEMAGHPLEAMALLGCGVRTLSMTPGAVPAVRGMVRSADLNRLSPLMAELSDAPALSLRERLRGYAKDNGIRV